jgi:hypothetical protein
MVSTAANSGAVAAGAKGQSAQALPGTSGAQALPIVETLNNMNQSTAKFARWIVRVITARVHKYEFVSRGETVHAEKFMCVLVSSNSKEYMMGVVPFSFSNRNAAQEAAKKFREGTSWEITQPVFDSAQKAEYVSYPVKTVMKLTDPTKLRPIPPTEVEMYSYAAKSVHPPTTLAQTVELLGKISFQQHRQVGTATRMVDISCKLRSKETEKVVQKEGRNRRVVNLIVTDDSVLPDGSKAQVAVSVWDSAIDNLHGSKDNSGVCLLGCTATKSDEGGLKLNVWDSAFWVWGGERAQSLTGMDVDTDESKYTTLTPTFTPTARPIDVTGTAQMTCAAGLSAVVNTILGDDVDKVFQINRCYLDAPVFPPEALHTQDGQRLFVRAMVRDWTGAVEVEIVADAVPYVYGLGAKQEVEQALLDQTLSVEKRRVNVRGVLRLVQGTLKKYIAGIVPSPFDAVISGRALRATLGLAKVSGDVVQVAPATRIVACPILSLAVQGDNDMNVHAHRVMLLVQGTSKSKLSSIGRAPGSASDNYLVESTKVACRLSETETFVDLRGYCNLDTMLDYRLDTEAALIVVSAIADGTERKVMTLESVQKVSQREVTALAASLAIEWKVALTQASDFAKDSEFESPMRSEYWAEPSRALKRIISEPGTPTSKSLKMM